jgi:hypothetical protein
MLDKVLSTLPVLNIRPMYTDDGYRSHSDNPRKIEITYSDYNGDRYSTLIVPDTFATGRSVEAAIKFLFRKGLSIEKLVLYGFIAIPGIERLSNLSDAYGFELFIFAICDITQLSSNNYDMPLYGVDENLHENTTFVSPLGSIVSLDTLCEMVNFYIPGMDQPGDWSERQSSLFNGASISSGDIRGHIIKSIALIKSLDKINRNQKWYNETIEKLTQKELNQLQHKLLDFIN